MKEAKSPAITRNLFSSIAYSLFFLVLSNTLLSQTYDLRLTRVSNNGSTLVMKVQASFSSAENLGSSNLVFTYDGAEANTPVLGTIHNFSGGSYSTMTLTSPATNTVSLNIEYTGADGGGTAVPTGGSFIDVAEVSFTIPNETGTANFQWQESTTTKTVVYQDDNSTFLSSGTLSNNDLSLDATAPTLINQALAQTDSDDLQITYQSNETGTLYYVVTTNSSTPTQAQIKAGNDQSGNSTNVVSSGNAAVTVTGSNQTIALNGLTLSSTTYHLFIYEEDAAGNQSSVVTNSAAVDATAPTLINQAIAQTDFNDLQITYQSNETGTLYYVVTTNSSTPTQAQILAGNDQSGNSTNVVSSGNAAVTVTGSNQTIALNGLTLSSTTYHLFIYEEDAIGNQSSVVTNSAAVDATAPTLVNQAIAQTDFNDLQITYQSNETGTLYYVVTTNSSTPTQAQILAGNDQSGNSTNVVSSGNAAVTVTGSNQTIALNGLTLSSTTYHLFIYEEDAIGNQSSVVTNSAAVDATAPTLINQALAQTASNALQITYQSNETGTLYHVVTTNSSTPTQAQIKAGNDQSGGSSNVVSSGNAAVTVTGSDQTIALNGLTLTNTTYHLFIYEEDGVGNQSSVVTNSATIDNTAPTLINQALAQTASNALQITYQSNETGTLYHVVTTNSSTPTQAQIKAGNDQSGGSSNVVSSGNAAVTVTGSDQTIALNGLTLANTTYHLFIYEEDAAGNESSVVTNNVVIDLMAPTLSSVSIASSQTATEDFADASHATTGNLITLSFTASEALSANPTVGMSIGGTGVTATVNAGSAPNYTATYTILGTENEGAVTFTIDFTDAAGNAGTQVTAVTNASSVEADFNAPTLSSVTLSTNNSTDNQHGTTGDVVTLSFTSTDVLSANPTVGMSIGGTGVTATVNDLGSNNYSATYTLLGTENEGAVTFTIDFTDDAGISGTQVTATTNASSVEADFNAPTLSTVTIASSQTASEQFVDASHASDGNTVTLDIVSSDVLSALPTVAIKSGGTNVQGPVTVAHDNPGAPDFQNFNVTYVVDGVGSTPGTDKDADGAVTFTVDFVDDAGISGTQVTATTNASTVTVDNTDPTLTSVSIASSQTATEDFVDASHATTGNLITLSFTSSDALSANPTVGMSIGGTGVTATVNTGSAPNYTATYTLLGTENEGAITFTIDFVDDAGNSGTQVTATTNASSIEADFNAPTLTTVTLSTNNSTDNQHGTTGDVVTLSFTSTDVLSANPTVGMSIGGTGVTATVNDLGSNNYSATYTLLGTENEGAVTFTIDFVDDAGISGTQVTATTDASSVEADFNAPTLSTVTLITDNGTDNQRAKDGNTVLLDLASSDVLSALPTVAIKSGGTDVQGPITVAHDNPGAPDFQNFNVTYAVDGVGSTPGTDKDADGAVTFTVDFVDDAGISGTQVTATTNASMVTVDASAPTVTGVSSSTADGSFIAGNVIAVTVTFSESVTVAGTPQLTLETGTTDRTVNYTSGSPSTTLTFNYTVQAGDVSADLDYETNNSLALNSGTITDGAGNAATLTLPSPAAPNSLGANKALVIDTSNPTISSTSPLDNATDVGISGDITITFNEDIAFGTGNITLVDITGAGTNTIVIDAASPGSQASISGAVLTINPTANLELNNNYSVQIAATAIDDTAGNSFAGITDNTTLNFTTINTSVAFSNTTSSAAESTSSANLAVSLNSASGATVTVNYAVVGTATGGGTDYTLADGTLTFNPGDVTKNITIASIIDDALDENDETVIVTLSNPTNAGLGTNTQHTYTINDNDATPTVSFNTTASNGAESVSSADLQVNLSAVSGRNVTVNYTITGTATGSGTDFTLANGALVINAGDANNNITIGSIVEDALDEVDETVIVSLSSPVNATLGSNTQHIYTINDNDATPTVSFNSTSSQGAESISSANLQVDLSAASGQDVMVDYTVTGTATGSGSDYTLADGTLTITAGASLDNITIASIIANTLDEDDETVIVTLSNPVNATLGTNTVHTYTIQDDDASPTTGFVTTSSNGDESTSSFTLSVALTGESGRDITLNYAVTGTATGGGTDYTLADGTFTLEKGVTSKDFTIPGIVDDLLDEDNETIIVTLSNPVNAILASSNAVHTYTITDNDAEPTVAFALATDAQTEDQPSQDVQVSLSAISGKSVTVNYVVTGTATAGGTDHTTTGGTITFNPGDQNFQQQIVGIVDDLLDEENETIILTLSSPSNATLGGQTTHTYTITDNDAEPTVSLSVDNSSIDEASGTATLTATLSAVSGKNVDVTIGYSGTAINGTDYNSNASTTITINAGSPSATAAVIITPVNDGDPEAAETIILDITAVTNGTEDGTQQQTITITDDDTPDLTFTAASSNGAESVSSAGITVDLSLASGLTVTADYALTGTATEGTDYTLAAGTLTFNPGDVQETITIASIVDDAILEANETVIVTLTNLSNANAGTNQIHTYTINNNDAAAVTIADVSQAENGGDITVTATLDNAVEAGFTVDVSTADGMAETGDSDYTAVTSQTLTFSGTAGEMQTFTITPTADTKLEANETLTVSQGNLAGTSLSVGISDGATVTINNDDNAAVTIEDVSGAENGGAITLTATLDNAVQGGFSVDVVSTDNTATTADSDYTALTGTTLTFTGTAGETQQFTVTPTADTKVEANESLFLGMQNIQGTTLTINNGDGALVTINNDDAATLAIDDVTMNEGASGTATYTFTTTLTGDIDQAFTVDYATQDGTATTADSDYTTATGTLNFAGTNGETQSFSVSVNGDDKVELDEAFSVLLSNLQAGGKNLTITDDTGAGTITNDDNAAVTIADISQAENGGDITVTATLDNAVQGGFTVDVSTTDGTAAAGSDYTAVASETLTFAGTAGETQTFTISPTADAIVEADENLTVSMGNLANTAVTVDISDGATIGITNDDTAIFTISDANSNENGSGNEDDGAITMVITLDKAVDMGFDVRVRSQASSATEGTDYTVLDETLTFSGTVGETKTFTVIPTADQVLEADEVLDVGIFSTTLDNNVRDRNIDDQATVTITNDDAASLAITDVTMAEGNSGTTTFTFDVTLTGAVDQQVMVDYTTADGTATTADSDYTAASGTLTFNGSDGEVQQITVDITGDMTEESDEVFTVTLSNVVDGNKGVTIATATGTGTLTNEDDNTAPSGYSVSFDDNLIISTELTSSTITMAGAEVGTTYNFTISSAGGGINVTGTGTIATATDQITLGDLTGLGDGTLTISLELTDGFSNTGSAVTGTTEKKAILVDPVLSPADDAVDILPSSDLTMTFGENMNKGTGNITIKQVGDDSVLETIDVTSAKVTISGGEITINPENQLLPPSTEFYVTIDAGALKDDVENDYAGISNNTDWSFTTIAASVVSNVIVPADGTYAIGTSLDFTVNMVLPVTITGTATLPITMGSVTVNATQVGTVSESTSIVFRYTIVEDNLDVDGISLDAPMDLNGGTMRDSFDVDAILSLNNVATLTGVLVDGVRPVPTLSTVGDELTNAAFTTTFSYDKSVSDFDLADITVTNGIASNFTEVTAGSVWSADITPSADGTVSVTLAAGVATDVPGNASAAGNTVSKTFDGTVPTVSTITRKEADQLNTATTTANFRVTFSESVSGVDATDFEVALSGTTGAINTVTAVDDKTYDVNVNGISGEGTVGINVKDDDSILDDAGNALGGTGVDNGDFTTGQVYATNALPTDITLSGSISENNAIGDVARVLSSVDADTGDSHTYALVSGTGDTDNASFSIVGNELKAGLTFDFETKDSYTVRVKTDDGFGGSFEKALTIDIDNVLEPSVFIVQDETEFDISALGLSQERTITITNDGEIPVEVRTISTPVGFEVIPGALILSVGTSADVTISFVPTEARAYSGNIVFEYSFDDQKVNLTHAVAGEGAVITSVDNGSINAANISIYPNPADRLLTIDLSEINAGKLDIEIINTTGVKLFGIDGFTEKELRLDVSSYEAGIYIVQFNNGTSIVRKKVMIKR